MATTPESKQEQEGKGIANSITSDDLVEKKKYPNQLEKENERLKAKQYDQDQRIKALEAQLEHAKAEKRKPGITEVDEDGQQRYRKRPNSLGLSDLIMPPYTKGRVAIYRICGAESINPATGLPVEPVDIMIPGRYILHDRFEKDPLKRDKVMKNVVGTETVVENGEEVQKEVIEGVIFERGWLQVPIESEFNLYVFIELHSNNKSNKFRPKNAPQIFERVDINYKSAASKGATLDLGIDAAIEIRKMDRETIYAYATSAEIPTMLNGNKRLLKDISTDLTAWAMANPILYYKLNKNAKAAIQITVIDAINFGLIGYRPDVKGYVNLETDEVICNHTAAEDPMDKFVKYLANDERGKEWYEQIQERMNFWQE